MGDNRLIRERYRLIERIGRGGMGEVWRARDEELDRQVAVKILKQVSRPDDPQHLAVMRERFRREARVAAGLQHRGITVVHDFGADDGVLYLVMELLDGRTLSQLLDDQQRAPLAVRELADIGEQVAGALAYTHAKGVVHRDLKPANVLRLTDGTVKICDFGIARLGHDVGFTSRLTGTGLAMGTPHYMSPEQIAGADAVDHRSDLYSFGCVLYELATGAPPFDLDDAWAVLIRHRTADPEPPRARRPELPAELDRLILELLAKEPDDRPADAAEAGRRLAAIRRQAARERGLPPWARGVTDGAGATLVRRGRPRPGPAALTGTWFTGAPTAVAAGPAATAVHRPAAAPSPPAALPASRPAAASVLPHARVAGTAGRYEQGLAHAQAGRWAGAAEAFAEVAAAREAELGPNDPAALAGRYELGFALARLGRTAEALASYERVAEGRSAVLGPDHPGTLAARQEAAYALGRLGRHRDAERLYRDVLARRERTAGPDHPDTLRCRHNLAYTLGRLGRIEEAHRTAAQVHAARARVLGETHADTLATRAEVAYALGRLDRWEEALAEYREVARLRGRTLGTGHPDALAADHEVGICLGRLGRSAEALELYRALAAARARTSGPDDPETLRARHGYGVNLGRLHRWSEALETARAVCAARERVLGPGHPDTLVSRREVAVALGWLDRWDEALGAYRAVTSARGRYLGASHPDTLAAREDEAACLERLGRVEEAAELRRGTAALRGNRESVA